MLTLANDQHGFKAHGLQNIGFACDQALGMWYGSSYGIIWDKTLISWSVGHGFNEIRTWHLSEHQNPNSWRCYYGTLWLTFEHLFDLLNPNCGPMCWDIDCKDSCFVWRPWLGVVNHETLIRDAWYLCANWGWLLIMELTETLDHWGRGSCHTFYHESWFIKLALCIRFIHLTYMHICLGFHLVQVL